MEFSELLLHTVVKIGKSCYTESELILPALAFLNSGSNVKTSNLVTNLQDMLKPTGRDAKIIAGRSDTYFSQKVRNLQSHKALQRRGLATLNSNTHEWTISEKGKSLISENEAALNELLRQGFDVSHIGASKQEDFSTLIIEEGGEFRSDKKQRLRSSKLKKYAVKEFLSQNGSIYCEACTLNFKSTYGTHGHKYIEMHHLRPLYKLRKSYKVFLPDALANVKLVCSNCHRMIHRKKKNLEWDNLIDIIDAKYKAFNKNASSRP